MASFYSEALASPLLHFRDWCPNGWVGGGGASGAHRHHDDGDPAPFILSLSFGFHHPSSSSLIRYSLLLFPKEKKRALRLWLGHAFSVKRNVWLGSLGKWRKIIAKFAFLYMTQRAGSPWWTTPYQPPLMLP